MLHSPLNLRSLRPLKRSRHVKEVITDKSNQIDAIQFEVPQRLADIMLETKNFVSEEATAVESQFQDAARFPPIADANR